MNFPIMTVLFDEFQYLSTSNNSCWEKLWWILVVSLIKCEDRKWLINVMRQDGISALQTIRCCRVLYLLTKHSSNERCSWRGKLFRFKLRCTKSIYKAIWFDIVLGNQWKDPMTVPQSEWSPSPEARAAKRENNHFGYISSLFPAWADDSAR